MKLVRKVKVKNDLGLHTRPATHIVQMLQRCKSDVRFIYKKDSINAKSILSILTLAARKGTQLTVTVEGEDAEEIMQKLALAFETRFGE